LIEVFVIGEVVIADTEAVPGVLGDRGDLAALVNVLADQILVLVIGVYLVVDEIVGGKWVGEFCEVLHLDGMP
jgi:hypothetical protein